MDKGLMFHVKYSGRRRERKKKRGKKGRKGGWDRGGERESK